MVAEQDAWPRFKKMWKECQQRLESVGLLLAAYRPRDAALLMEALRLDCANATLVLLGQETVTTWEDACRILETEAKVPPIFQQEIDAWREAVERPREIKAARRATRSFLDQLQRLALSCLAPPARKRRRWLIRAVNLLLALTLLGAVAAGGYGLLKTRRGEKRTELGRQHLAEITRLAREAKRRRGVGLDRITGSVCSWCACRRRRNLRNLGRNDPCRRNWEQAITRIYQVVHPQDKVPSFLLVDPWGRPYLLDEDERGGRDYVFSAGANGVINDADDIGARIGN